MDYEDDIDKMNDTEENPEKGESIEDKFSKYPLMRNPRFKPVKEIIPFTPPEEVKLYRYNIKKPFKSFKRISVRSNEHMYSKTAAIDDVNGKLKEKASSLGANAVIRVVYNQSIFSSFRGMKGTGQAVYIEDLENIEKTFPTGSGLSIFLGISWLFLGLLGYNDYHQFYISFGLILILEGVFIRLDYINKTYFLVFLSIIFLNGLMWGRYNFGNGIQLYNPVFYFNTGIFAVIIIAFVYLYKNRKNDPNRLWKDQWGFK